MENEKERVKDKGWKKMRKKRKKKKEGMEWKREKKGTSFFFSFCFLFRFLFSLFRRHSFASIHFLPLSALFSSDVFFEHTFLLWAKFNLPFSIPGKWRTTKHKEQCKNRKDTLFVICFILYRSSFIQIFIFFLRIIWNSLTWNPLF